MAAKAKAFLAICTLGGGCGGVRWLLRGTQKGDTGVTQIQSVSPDVSEVPISRDSSPASDPLVSPDPEHSSRETELPLPQLPAESLPPTSSPVAMTTNAQNCTVKKELNDLENLLWTTDISDFDIFVKVICTNANKDPSSPMSNKWEGLFPNSLFKDRKELTYEKKFEIKTETKSLEEGTKYKTTFSGSHFYDDIEGEWEKKDPIEAEFTEVTIVSSRSSGEKIYLLFKK